MSHPHRRAIRILIAILAVAAAVTPFLAAPLPPEHAHAATTPVPDSGDAAAAVAGRLGGTRATITEAFGPPVAEDTVNGSRYAVDDFGLVLVSFRQTTDTILPDDVAAVIVLRAPRPEFVPATVSDPADWSRAAARRAAESFLPRDVDLGEPAETADEDRLAASCTSRALELLSPPARTGAAPGDCTVTFLTPDGETVSFITLALGDAETGADAPDPCAGMPAWAAVTAERLTGATTALDAVGALAEDDPVAAATLDEIAATFATLAEDQAATPVPPAAVAANAALVSAFTAYAEAIALAATGLADGDQIALADAATAIEAARTGYAGADALILAAIDGCEP